MSCCDMWSSSKRSGGSGGSVRAAPELTSVPRLGSKIGGDATVVGRHPANRGDKPGFRRDQVGESRSRRVQHSLGPIRDAIEHLRQLLLDGDQVLADSLFSVVRHLGRLGPLAPLIPPDRLAKKSCGFLTETFVIS